jgi:hypothetical protein
MPGQSHYTCVSYISLEVLLAGALSVIKADGG